jgi:hypothetical protein
MKHQWRKWWCNGRGYAPKARMHSFAREWQIDPVLRTHVDRCVQTHVQGHQRGTIHQQWWLWQEEQTGGSDAVQTIGRQVATSIVVVVEGVGIAIEWGTPVVVVAVVSRL